MDDIAKQLGTNRADLFRMLEIERKLTPELKAILDAGEINKRKPFIFPHLVDS